MTGWKSALLSLALFAAFLAACGKNEEEASPPASRVEVPASPAPASPGPPPPTESGSAGLPEVGAADEQAPPPAAEPDVASGPAAIPPAAKSPPVVSGPLKRSDVLFSPRFYRPDWLEAFRAFDANRIVWTYAGDRYVAEAAAQGIPVQCAIPFWVPRDDPEKDEMTCSDPNGAPVSAAPTQVFPDVNSEAWRRYVLAETEKLVDAGCTSFQQDSAWLNYQSAIWRNGCYSSASLQRFESYRRAGGPSGNRLSDGPEHPAVRSNAVDDSFEEFQKRSTLAYHRWLHDSIKRYADGISPAERITFSGNFAFSVLAQGRSKWLLPDFDFALSEAFGNRKTMPNVLRGIARQTLRATGVSGVTFPTNDAWLVQRSIATAYALGLTAIVPWDVHIPKGEPRYFGDPADFAPLFRMVRKNMELFDDFISDLDFYGNNFGPVLPAEGVVARAGDVAPYLVTVRKNVNEPRMKAVHVVSWADMPAPLSLYLRRSDFPYPPAALLTPDSPRPTSIEPVTVGDYYVYAVGAPLWAILY